MKIQKFKSKQILKLYLLKSKMYEQVIKKNNFNFSGDVDLVRILTSFKKVLQIIFNFHKLEKRILFIGMPKKLEVKVNRLTNHVAVPTDFDLQGTLSKNLDIKKFKSNDVSVQSLLPKLSTKPDLIVIFSAKKRDFILSESYSKKIPLINFGTDCDLKDVWLNNSYNVRINNSNFISTSNKNLFFIGLNFLFKAGKKKVRNQISTKFTKSSFKKRQFK